MDNLIESSNIRKILKLRNSNSNIRKILYSTIISASQGFVDIIYNKVLNLSLDINQDAEIIIGNVFTENNSFFAFANKEHQRQIIISITNLVDSFRINQYLVEKYSKDTQGLIMLLGLDKSLLLNSYVEITLDEGIIHIVVPDKNYFVGTITGADGFSHFRDLYLEEDSSFHRAVFIANMAGDIETFCHERLHAISYFTIDSLDQLQIDKKVQKELVSYLDEIYNRVCNSGLKGDNLQKLISGEIYEVYDKLCTYPLYLSNYLASAQQDFEIKIFNQKSLISSLKEWGADQKDIDKAQQDLLQIEADRDYSLDSDWYVFIIRTYLERGLLYLQQGGTIDTLFIIPLQDWDKLLPTVLYRPKVD